LYKPSSKPPYPHPIYMYVLPAKYTYNFIIIAIFTPNKKDVLFLFTGTNINNIR